jgi:hypothetical protein
MKNLLKIAELEQLIKHNFLLKEKQPEGTLKRILKEEILQLEKELIKELNKK